MLDEMGGEAEASEEEVPLEEEDMGEEDAASSGSSEFDSFADLALDTSLPMAERRAALKEAIMACMGTDYEDSEESGAGSSLAAICGG